MPWEEDGCGCRVWFREDAFEAWSPLSSSTMEVLWRSLGPVSGCHRKEIEIRDVCQAGELSFVGRAPRYA